MKVAPAGMGISTGDVLADKYTVEQVIGRGGMGIVVGAVDKHLDRRVAIKVMTGNAGDEQSQEEAIARFRREARAAARIDSDHIARVFETGTLPDGTPYMVMELLDGEDVASFLKKSGGRLPLASAVSIIVEACVALAEAHCAGIVHRDLKPANLFLATRSDGSTIVKVLDFGVSKYEETSRSSEPLTRTNSIVGSLNYISPEQMASAKDVDPRADIWAIGVIFYRLLAGRTPFDRGSMPETVAAILQNTPPPISEARPDIPPEFDQVVRKCMRSDRSERYADVGELVSALSPFAPSESTRPHLERIMRVLAHNSSAVVNVSGIKSIANPLPLSAASMAAVQPNDLSHGNLPTHVTSNGTPPRKQSTRLLLGGAFVSLLVIGLLVKIAPWNSSPDVARPASSPSGITHDDPSAKVVLPASSVETVASATTAAIASAPVPPRAKGPKGGSTLQAGTKASADPKAAAVPRNSAASNPLNMGIKE